MITAVGRGINRSGLVVVLAAGLAVCLLVRPLGVGAQRGGTDAGADTLGALLSDPEQQTAWDRLSRAALTEKPRLAADFLVRFPSSPLAPVAHFHVAAWAFERQEYPRFVEHAEAALRGMQTLVEAAPGQQVRRFQMLSQLSFYYAETGAAAEAAGRAEALLRELESAAAPPGLGSLQWEQFRRLARAAARYARGRAALSLALREESEAARAERLRTASAELEAALALNPADGYAAFRWGDALGAAGERDRAADAYARAAVVAGPAAAPAREKLTQLVGRRRVEQRLDAARARLTADLSRSPRALMVSPEVGPHPVFWWDAVPEEVREGSVNPPFSNLRFEDYVGPEACRECHQEKVDSWRKHAHSRMNAWATPEAVAGDFSGEASIRYQGGEAVFLTRDGGYEMQLRRGALRRTYRVVRTLGSRFFQYYVGVQLEGPEPKTHPVYQIDHVLPFGYWLEEREWAPVVHINDEVPDERRADLFAEPSRIAYDRSCSPCHTTRPFGDWLMTTDGRLRAGAFSPREFSFDLRGYLANAHPEWIPAGARSADFSLSAVRGLLDERANALPAKDYAVVLGVSCEACHNGAREHVRQSDRRMTRQPPLFFPAGKEIFIPSAEGGDLARLWGRRPENLKWICSRCHSGGRPRYAAGIDTWNSTEFSDAARGACYEGTTPEGFGPLTCTHCHDPHVSIGPKWSRPPALDDGRCLACHAGLRPPDARQRHTRHPGGTEGARCMNCHMPRLNEGLQEMVRTHHIFSPTENSMLEANQPNACNLCHLDRSLDWTLDALEQWYGKTYDRDRIRSSGADLTAPASLGWLKSPHEPTRLAAADALGRAEARWALPQLIEMLDDPYLINRQFTQRRLERMLGRKLEEFGYRFYQSPKERAKPVKALRKAVEAGEFQAAKP